MKVAGCIRKFLVLPVLFTKHVLCKIPENSSSPMIAYMIMTNITRSAIWSRGIIAIMILFSTIWRPEIKEIRGLIFAFTCDVMEASFVKYPGE